MRQGCSMSLWLCIQHLSGYGSQRSMRQFRRGVTLNACKVQVYDTVLVAESDEDLERNIAALQEAMREQKLWNQLGKSKHHGGRQGAYRV